jgi:hypothetical protein
MKIFKLAAAIELALIVLKAAMELPGLPLGGGDVEQIGIVFGSAFVLSEVSPGCSRGYDSAVRAMRRMWLAMACKDKNQSNEGDHKAK